jgi:hypothetical protein
MSLDDATVEVVRGSLREVFATGRPVAPALDELGWAEVLEEDPSIATTVLFGEQGRALASSGLLADTMLAELPGYAPGTHTLLLPHPRLGSHPGPTGVLLASTAEVVVVPRATPDGVVLATIERSSLVTRPAGGFDPGSGWQLVTLGAALQPDSVPVGAAWERAVATGRRALAAEIIGVCTAALELAVTHTSVRHQYGRPLGSFQSVRHQLAEAHAALEAARVTLDTAWSAAEDVAAWAATVAKLRAGATQSTVLRRTVQVLGAMGITLESDMHRYVSRGAALDALLGGHLRLADEVGSAALAGADLHPVVTT